MYLPPLVGTFGAPVPFNLAERFQTQELAASTEIEEHLRVTEDRDYSCTL